MHDYIWTQDFFTLVSNSTILCEYTLEGSRRAITSPSPIEFNSNLTLPIYMWMKITCKTDFSDMCTTWRTCSSSSTWIATKTCSPISSLPFLSRHYWYCRNWSNLPYKGVSSIVYSVIVPSTHIVGDVHHPLRHGWVVFTAHGFHHLPKTPGKMHFSKNNSNK